MVLGSLGFENAYAFAMRPDRARALGVASLADLAREAPKLTLGSDLEFLSRPEWKAVDAAYGLGFKAKRSYQPTFMYRAPGRRRRRRDQRLLLRRPHRRRQAGGADRPQGRDPAL